MRRILVRSASSLYACSRSLFRPTYSNANPCSSLAPLAASTLSRLNFYSSNGSNFTQTQNRDSSIDIQDASNQELKKLMEKYHEGEDEVIPSIFEAILERKLADFEGKHEEGDDKWMEEICGKEIDKSLDEIDYVDGDGDGDGDDDDDEGFESDEDIDDFERCKGDS